MAEYSKYVIPTLIVIVLATSILIIRPFIIPLITSAIIAYTFYPIFKKINKYVKKRTIAAAIVTLLILLIILVPLLMIANTVSREGYIIYVQGKELLLDGLTIEDCTSTVCESIKNWFNSYEVQESIQKSLEAGTTYLVESASRFIFALPQLTLEIFITLFTTFYLIRDGDKLMYSVNHLFSTNYGKRKVIMNRFNDVMRGVLFGSLLIAFVQGVVGGMGFVLFGISSPITWGIAMFFFALIPYIGTGLIWVPAALMLVVEGISTSNTFLIWKGIGLFLYGLLVIASIDNVIKPKVIGNSTRVHPVVVLIGIFGGLTVMGIPGLIVGPVILAMALTFLEQYVHQHKLTSKLQRP